jgi:hypothetical protein
MTNFDNDSINFIQNLLLLMNDYSYPNFEITPQIQRENISICIVEDTIPLGKII